MRQSPVAQVRGLRHHGSKNPYPGPASCFGASPFGRPLISAHPHWLALASSMCEGPANGAPQNEGAANGGRRDGPPKKCRHPFQNPTATQGANHPPRGFQGILCRTGFRILCRGGFRIVCRGGRIFDRGDVDFFAGGISNFLSERTSVFAREKYDFFCWRGL